MESILTSIKKLLGIEESCEHFDVDLIMHIKSGISILSQLGVGPSKSLRIEDKSTTWHELISDNTDLEYVKTYVYLKVRLLFDPPLSSSVMNSINQIISELEWRITSSAEDKQSN